MDEWTLHGWFKRSFCDIKCLNWVNFTLLLFISGIYPTYFLHYERDNGKRIFLLAGRKRKKCSTSTYVLSTDPTDLSRQGDSTLATVRLVSQDFFLHCLWINSDEAQLWRWSFFAIRKEDLEQTFFKEFCLVQFFQIIWEKCIV